MGALLVIIVSVWWVNIKIVRIPILWIFSHFDDLPEHNCKHDTSAVYNKIPFSVVLLIISVDSTFLSEELDNVYIIIIFI